MWILISKKLYDANKTISEQQAGPSVDLSKYYWYNTDTKQILPATEIPQSGVVDGQPINVNAPGVRTDISQNAKNLWFDSSKEVLYDDALSQFGISIGSDIREFFKLASQYGISTFGYGEEGSIYQTTDEIKNKIAADLIDLITNNAFTDKNLVEINKIQNEGIDLLQFKTQGPVVTIFKGNAEKEIDQSDLTLYLQSGWTTGKPTDDKDEQDEEVTVTVYRGNEVKTINQSDLTLFLQEGWTTGKPTDDEVDEVDEVVAPTVETVGISNNWNTDGSNIINLNGKRYALFEKDNTFRSAGSEEEFNQILGEGFTPIGNQNPIWLNFSESENLDDIEIIVSDDSSYDDEVVVGSEYVGTAGTNEPTVFNNIPTGAKVFDVDGDYYLGYLVPGGDGSLYTGSMYMMYQVPGNDFVKAGLLLDESAFTGANSFLTKEDLNTGGAIVAGTTAELEGIEGNPFLQFVESVSDNLSISPWLGTSDGLALAAETALEGRDPTPGEYNQLKWYQDTTEEQRAWYELSMGRGFNNLPLDAKQAYEDARINVKNNLIASGVSGGFDPTTGELRDLPQGLVDYLAKKSVTGEWSVNKTNEQLKLFADPFAAGERDDEFFNVIETGAYQVDRQTQYEDTVRQEALKWLGPIAGNFNAGWVANWASKLRSGEPDAYEQLQTLLKQQRVALFDAYTNPELTYDDISQPWKNIVENAWGEIPDESETYFQDIVKNNNVTYANEVLTKVGLEKGNDNVVNDALNSLEQAIGQGTVERNLGANT